MDLCFIKLSLGPWSVENSIYGGQGWVVSAEGVVRGANGGNLETSEDAIWGQGKGTVAWLLTLALTPAPCHVHLHTYTCAPSLARLQEFLPLCHIARPT